MDDFSTLIANVQEETFGLIEPGEYLGYIESIEERQTKSGTGSYLNLKIKLKDGRYIFDMVTVKNDNKQAEEIGRARLKRLSNLCNSTQISGLLKKPMSIRVGIKESAEYGKQNKIVAYNEKHEKQSPASIPNGLEQNNIAAPQVKNDFKTDDIPF